MRKPDFLYIGIARAGSTWLFEMLKQHPDIYVPPAKDLYFFDRYYDKGLEWYLSHFQHAEGASAVGELSHDYYFSTDAAARIRRDLPDVKLICCLREPVSRLLSGYAYNRTTEVRREISLESYAAQPEVAIQFEYYRHLRHYINVFGRDRIHITFYKDLVTNPQQYIQSIYRFLGVDSAFVPPALHDRVNAAREVRIEPVALFAYRLALVMRRLGMANWVGRIKQHQLVNKILYTSTGSEAPARPSPELIAHLRRDNQRLEELLGRRLPESWYA